MRLSFPLQPPLILRPSREIEDWSQFQLYLKVCGFINQDGLCVCGEYLGTEGQLHHALISRKDVMGMDFPEYIHCSYNVLVLHHKCHVTATRQNCYKKLCTIFNKEELDTWYQQASFKSNFRRLF